MIAYMKILATALISFTLLVACNEPSFDGYLASAQEEIDKKNYSVAVIQLKNAVALKPKDAQARFLLGQTYLAQAQYAFAEKELERALSYGYPDDQVIPMLAEVYQHQGENNKLLALTTQAKALSQIDRARIALYQLQAFAAQGQTDKAQALIIELAQLAPSEYSLIGQAYEQILNQQLDLAILQLDQVLSEYPNQPDALKLKASLHLDNQQMELAAQTYQQYITHYPNEHEIQLQLAHLYMASNQADKAEPIIDALLALYPQNSHLLPLKASARLSQQDFLGALVLAEQVLNTHPDDTSTRLVAGISAYLLQQFETSRNHLALIASHLPSEHPALRMLADSQLRLGLSLEASDTAERFEALSAQDAELFSELAITLMKQGEVNKVKAILNKQKNDISSSDALAKMASVKISLNDVSGLLDLEQALTQARSQAALEQGSESNNAKPASHRKGLSPEQIELALAQAYLATHHYDKALIIAESWQQQSDKSSQLKGLILSANIYSKQGDTEQAKQAYLQARLLKPDSPAIELGLIGLMPAQTRQEQQAVLTQINLLVQQYPDYLPARLQRYIFTKRLNQPEQITEYLTKQIQAQPNEAGLKVLLGKIWLLEGKPEYAIDLFLQAKQDYPEAFWAQLAAAYVATRQFDKAKELYQLWFDQQPNQPQAVAGMIKVHEMNQQTDAALALANRYLTTTGGRHFEIILLQLQLLAKTQQYDALQIAIDALPTSLQALPTVKGLLGQIQLNNNQLSEASANLRDAYQAKPSSTNTEWLLNAIYQTQGQAQALIFLKQHVDKYPIDQDSVLRYAILQTGKNNDEAKVYYLKAIELNPNNFIAHNNLANLYSDTHDLSSALAHAKRAHEINPNAGEVLDTLGGIELQLGHNDAALTHLTQAISLLEKQSSGAIPEQAVVNYIEALLVNGQHQLAQRKISQFPVNDKAQQQRLANLLALYSQ